MGIKNLISALRRAGYEPQPITTSVLSGAIVAIDGGQFFSRHLATAHRRYVEVCSLYHVVSGNFEREAIFTDAVRRMVSDIKRMLSANIAPVLVLDGEKTVDQKKATREKRAKEREKTAERERELRDELAQVQDLETRVKAEEISPFAELDEMLEQNLDFSSIVERGVAIANAASSKLDPRPSTLKGKVDLLRSLSARSFQRFTRDETAAIDALLAALGVVVLEAPDEGERLCALLARKGVVDYVLSTDSDVLAFGATRLLRSTDAFDGFAGSAECYELAGVLHALDMTYPQFVDFCILLGTDFNSTIPGVGEVRARKLHRDLGGCLDTPMPNNYEAHRENLNIAWCRHFFTMKDIEGIEMAREVVMPRRASIDRDDMWENVPAPFQYLRDEFAPLLARLSPSSEPLPILERDLPDREELKARAKHKPQRVPRNTGSAASVAAGKLLAALKGDGGRGALSRTSAGEGGSADEGGSAEAGKRKVAPASRMRAGAKASPASKGAPPASKKA